MLPYRAILVLAIPERDDHAPLFPRAGLVGMSMRCKLLQRHRRVPRRSLSILAEFGHFTPLCGNFMATMSNELTPTPPLPVRSSGTGIVLTVPLLTAILGTAVTFALAHFVLPDDLWLRVFLVDRGPVQMVTTALFFWGVGHGLVRVLAIGRERTALMQCVDLLRAERIERARAQWLIERLQARIGHTAPAILTTILSYFRAHRPTRDEVWKVANDEVDKAHDRMEAEYRPLVAVLWLIPLSGFLGTVLGMSAAIGSFDALIGADGADLSALMPAVRGLAVAFDTTLLALALVVPLKLFEVFLQRLDLGLLGDIDRVVGSGLVQGLDLAGLAQQSPEEAALAETAQMLDRIRGSLVAIDQTLHSVVNRLHTVGDVERLLSELSSAARSIKEGVPQIRADLETMRKQSEQPFTLVRGRTEAER